MSVGFTSISVLTRRASTKLEGYGALLPVSDVPPDRVRQITKYSYVVVMKIKQNLIIANGKC